MATHDPNEAREIIYRLERDNSELARRCAELADDLAAAEAREREAKRMAVMFYEQCLWLAANFVDDEYGAINLTCEERETIERWRKELG